MPDNSAMRLANRAADRPETTALPTRGGSFDPVLDRLLAPVTGRLAVQLGAIPGLTDTEADAIRLGATEALYRSARTKVTRVLVLEVHAAKVSGRLTGPGSQGAVDLAVAVNGTIVATAPTLTGRSGRIFSVMIPESSLLAGANAVHLFAIEGGGGAPSLRPLGGS
jgi:hypothetical protein